MSLCSVLQVCKTLYFVKKKKKKKKKDIVFCIHAILNKTIASDSDDFLASV